MIHYLYDEKSFILLLTRYAEYDILCADFEGHQAGATATRKITNKKGRQNEEEHEERRRQEAREEEHEEARRA